MFFEALAPRLAEDLAEVVLSNAPRLDWLEIAGAGRRKVQEAQTAADSAEAPDLVPGTYRLLTHEVSKFRQSLNQLPEIPEEQAYLPSELKDVPAGSYTAEQLRLLSTNSVAASRKKVAEHWNTDFGTLCRLALDQDRTVRQHALINPNLFNRLSADSQERIYLRSTPPMQRALDEISTSSRMFWLIAKGGSHIARQRVIASIGRQALEHPSRIIDPENKKILNYLADDQITTVASSARRLLSEQ